MAPRFPLVCSILSGLVEDGNQEKFNRLRYVELKHMLAFLGQILTRVGIHFPGDIDYHGTAFADIGNGFAGLNDVPLAVIQQTTRNWRVPW